MLLPRLVDGWIASGTKTHHHVVICCKRTAEVTVMEFDLANRQALWQLN